MALGRSDQPSGGLARGVNVLLDTNVLLRLSRVVTACSLQPASQPARTPELSFGIQRLADGCRKERFRSYLQNLRRLMGCSCLYAIAGSASFKFAMGRS